MIEVKDILLRHNFSTLISKPNVSITDIENFIQFILPEDYKFYVTHFRNFGGFINDQYLELWNINDLIEYNEEYGIFKLPNTLGIGSNGAGEFVAIIRIELNQYRVVLSPFIDMHSAYHIEIGSSFYNMLVRLDNGFSWFN